MWLRHQFLLTGKLLVNVKLHFQSTYSSAPNVHVLSRDVRTLESLPQTTEMVANDLHLVVHQHSKGCTGVWSQGRIVWKISIILVDERRKKVP